MALRKPGSRQREILRRMLDGERLHYIPDSDYSHARMQDGNWAVVIDKRIPKSLFEGGYIEHLSDERGTAGWVVTEAGKKALEK